MKNIKYYIGYILIICILIILTYNIINWDVIYCDSPDNVFQNGNREKKYSNFSDFYNVYKNKGKCRLYWHFWKQYTNSYDSYKDFKKSWNSDIEIKDEIKKYFQDKRDKWKLFKQTAKFVISAKEREDFKTRRKNLRKSRNN